MLPGSFAAQFFNDIDPYDLRNVVRDQGSAIGWGQFAVLDVEQLGQITPKAGDTEIRIKKAGSDVVRIAMSPDDLYDELGVHAQFAGFNDSGVAKTWIDLDLGVIYANDAVIAGTISVGTGSTAGGWFINSTQIFSDQIALDSSIPAIKLGAATDYLTGTGIFMGKSGGVYKMHVGSSTSYFAFNGTVPLASGNWFPSAGANVALQRWETDIVFSSASDTQVNWTSGTIRTADGTTYSISSGNTGTMSALNYIYLDTAVSLTVLQKTTTYSTATGDGKILIAAAQNATAGASVLPFSGQQPLINGGAQITALSILAGNIAAGAITASKISVTDLAAVNANMGALTINSTLTMNGASGAIAIGTTPPSSATSGTGLWIDRTGVYSLTANIQNATLDSTGLTAGQGAVAMNARGVIVTGLLTALLFTATLGGNTRTLSASLQQDATATVPIGGIYYGDPTPGTNLITTNPGLEDGDTSGFTLTGSSVFVNSTTYAASGTHSLKAVGLAGAGTAKTTRYAVVAGTSYTASFRWMRGVVVPSNTPLAYLRFFDAVTSGNQVGNSLLLTNAAGASLNGFELWSVAGVAPVGATYAEIYISASTPSSSNDWYFDDFSISPTTLTRSLTFEPDLSYRENGTKIGFTFARKVFSPNLLVISSTTGYLINSFVIPANTITKNGILRIVNRGVLMNQTGSSQTIQMYPYLSGNIGSQTTLTLTNSTVERGYVYELMIQMDPNNNAKVLTHEILTVESGTLGADHVFVRENPGFVSNAAATAKDFTTNLTFNMQVALGASSGLLYVLSNFYSIEVLPGTDASAETYTWRTQSGSSTDMRSNTPTTNNSAAANLYAGESNAAVDTRRGLIKMTLPVLGTDIPSNAVITGARLIVFIQTDNSSNARDFKLYRVRRDWVVSQATWNIWKTGNNWTTAGAGDTTNDIDSTVWATTNFGAAETVDTAKIFSLDLTEFGKMLDGTYSNYGWIIKPDTELNDAYGFYMCNEATNLSERPILEVTYTIPPTGNE